MQMKSHVHGAAPPEKCLPLRKIAISCGLRQSHHNVNIYANVLAYELKAVSVFDGKARKLFGRRTVEAIAAEVARNPIGGFAQVGIDFDRNPVPYGDSGTMWASVIEDFITEGIGTYAEEIKSLGSVTLQSLREKPLGISGTIAWPYVITGAPNQFSNYRYDSSGCPPGSPSPPCGFNGFELGWFSAEQALREGYINSPINIFNPADIISFDLTEKGSIRLELSYKGWNGSISRKDSLGIGGTESILYPTAPYDSYVVFDGNPLRPLTDWGTPSAGVTDLSSVGLNWKIEKKGELLTERVPKTAIGPLYKDITVTAITPELEPGIYSFSFSPAKYSGYDEYFRDPIVYNIKIEAQAKAVIAFKDEVTGRARFKQADRELIIKILEKIGASSATVSDVTRSFKDQGRRIFDEYLARKASNGDVKAGYKAAIDQYNSSTDSITNYVKDEYLYVSSGESKKRSWISYDKLLSLRGRIVEIYADRLTELAEANPEKVSKHIPLAGHKSYAVDFSPRLMPNKYKKGFVDGLSLLEGQGGISKFLYPEIRGIHAGNSKAEQAYHVEFFL